MRVPLKASGADCSKGKYVSNGASCSFEIDDATTTGAKFQRWGVRCEHALCKDGVWSTTQPYCCCVSTFKFELGGGEEIGAMSGMIDACPVEDRCLKCPTGSSKNWITQTPSDLDAIDKTVTLSFQNDNTFGYLTSSQTSVDVTTESGTRGAEDHVLVWRNAAAVGEDSCYGTLNRRTRIIQFPVEANLKKTAQVTYLKAVLCSGLCDEKKIIVNCRMYEGLTAGVNKDLTCARGNPGPTNCGTAVTKKKRRWLFK